MQISPVSGNDKKRELQLKTKVAASAFAATGLALAHIAKRQGFSLSPSVIRKTPIKDWAIFKLQNKNKTKKVLEIEAEEIFELAGASVLGGLAAGLAFDDKKHRKAKLKEAVNQFLGNVTVPIACVWAVSSLYKKNKASIMKFVPQFKNPGKVKKFFNKALQAIPFSAATIASLTIGIISGNKVSNLLNEKVFHKKVDRKVKTTDFAPHVDDLGLAVSLMSEGGKVSSFIQRTVPLFLCVPGIETGMHKEK